MTIRDGGTTDLTKELKARGDFPDYDLPDRENPPYDRDRYLPPHEEKPGKG